jgi:hypothetical protein
VRAAFLMLPTDRSCANCRRHRQVSGVLRCEERRSNALGGVVILDVEHAKSAEGFERICALVAARCGFYQEAS